MKSFFRFLGKHKLYAIVEILGLSIALTFVILMNSVVMDVNSIDSSLKVPRNVFALHDETSAAFSFEIAPSLDEIPEIESSCMIYGLNASYGGDRIAMSAITSSFRDFFTLNFVQGGGPEATAVRKIFGCSRKAIFLDTVKSFVDPVLIGSVIAIPLAWWYIGYWLQQYSLRIDNGILIYLPAIIIVLITVIAAISVQAVRLMNSNPVESIKAE